MTTPTWWQNAICYQIYPRSFADSNGDGIGDLPGITAKLDYLQGLGVTALWISPFFPSPNFDWGYDVADYTAVAPEYGTLADFDTLLQQAHQRGIRILLDLVLNHTSDQHDWFQQSKSSRDNPYRDWYIWRDGGPNGEPPNDWEAIFGGSAWQYDETTGQFYYHYFFPEQPDLNWRNTAVKQAMFDAVRFWLDRGVDGFRLDAIGSVYEDPALPNTDVEASLAELFMDARTGLFEEGGWDAYRAKMRYQQNLPEVYDLMADLRALIDEYDERLLLGETAEVEYYGRGDNGLHSVFNFEVLNVQPPLNTAEIRRVLTERLPQIPEGAWESNTIGNHDRSRSYSFFADGTADRQRAQLALAMTLFLRGTPVIYYGEEIGMRDGTLPDNPDDFQDGLGTWFYHAVRRQRGLNHEEAWRLASYFCRDRCRNPMQWADAPNAGFAPASVSPWIPANADYAEGINVAAQENDPTSMLAFFKSLTAVRQQNEALRLGNFDLVPDTGEALIFWRTTAEQRCLVALNFGTEPVHLALGETVTAIYPTPASAPATDKLTLPPYAIAIFRSDSF